MNGRQFDWGGGLLKSNEGVYTVDKMVNTIKCLI